MRSALAAVSLLALIAPARAEDAEAKVRAQVFTSCHGVYHAMTLLAEKGKYAKSAAENVKAKVRFAKADEKAQALAREAYEANGDNAETISEELERSADDYEDTFDELGGDGTYDRAKMEAEMRDCDGFMKDE